MHNAFEGLGNVTLWMKVHVNRQTLSRRPELTVQRVTCNASASAVVS